MAAVDMEHTVALTEADGGPHEEHEATLLGLGPEGWVYVGLTIFILLAVFVGKAPKKIAEALDARIAETVRELEQAKSLRAEAEALLADAKAKAAAAHKDAESIIAHATVEAKELIEGMEKDASELIGRRQKMAEDKIGAAERSAIAEVRAKAASTAGAAAASLIAAGHDAKADKALIDDAIKGLGTVN